MNEILSHWNVGGPVQPLKPTVWQVGGGHILKAYSDHKSLARNLTAMHRLRAGGLPVPAVVPTKAGTDFVQREGLRYIMMTRLPGRPLALGGPADAQTLEAIGGALGRLHKAFQPLEHDAPYWDNHLLDEMQGWVSAAFQRQPWDGVTHEEFHQAVRQLAARSPALPRQLIHRDVHFGNFLFAEGRFSGYIDFDLSQRNIRLFDPCYLLLGLLLEGGENQVAPENWLPAVTQVLHGYEAFIPLTPAEKEAIPCVMECIELLCNAYFMECGETALARGAASLFHFVRQREAAIVQAAFCSAAAAQA